MTNSRSPQHANYRPEIDGLRAIAVVSVLLYHSKLAIKGIAPFSGGFIGVDIFFVISGFLIGQIIFTELRTTEGFSLSRFYERRARRILPAFLLVVSSSYPIAWLIMPAEAFSEFQQSILASLFFISNAFFFFNLTEYGADVSLLKPLLHTWSLSVEEQFYLFFPLFVFTLWKFLSNRTLMLFLFLLTGISYIYAIYLTNQSPELSFFSPFTRIWELGLGFLGSRFYRTHGGPQPQWIQSVLASVGLSLIFFSFILFREGLSHPGAFTALPVIGTMLVLLYYKEHLWTTKFLCWAPMRHIGLISYSLYLWHFPLLAYSRQKYFVLDLSQIFAVFGVTYLLSLITYKYIEIPFRNPTRISRQSFVLTLVLLYSALIAGALVSKPGVKISSLETYPRGTLLPSRLSFSENRKPVILVFGDSFIIGDDYKGEEIQTGNYTAALHSFDIAKYEVIFVSYLLCDLQINSNHVALRSVGRDKNRDDCESLISTLNSKDLMGSLKKVVVATHTPFRSFPLKWNIINYLISNSDVATSDVFVIKNYFNLTPKHDPRCDLIIAQRGSGQDCVRFIVEHHLDKFTEIDAGKEHYPNHLPGVQIVDPFEVFFGRPLETLATNYIVDNAPYESDGVPFLLDTTHNTSEFIVFFLDAVANYDGENLAIQNFSAILKR